jgi:hypothetical protein
VAQYLLHDVTMSKELGGSVLLGVAVVVFLAGPLRVADALYAYGLWPRLTPEEVRLKLKDSGVTVTECATGTNGWQYICQLPSGRRGVRQFYDKLGVQGSPFGIGLWTDLPPGPIPSWESYKNPKPINRSAGHQESPASR